MIKFYSFDIFDTLLTRKVATPTGIFVLMQDTLIKNPKYNNIPQDVRENFYNYRRHCEYRQRRIVAFNGSLNDITLDQIYTDLMQTYGLTLVQKNELMQLEIELEYENIIPIKENINLLKDLLNQGKTVVLISDMYLPREIIKTLLKKGDDILPTLKLYLSSELGHMKATSELFKYVKDQENIQYNEWWHFGDNQKSDYSIPLSLGINAKLYKYIKLKKYETAALNKYILNPEIQLNIGCAKNLRLENSKKSRKYDIGASLGGAILYPYISWLVDQAVRRNIGCLYFIARDGYLLKAMADVIIKKRNLNIETVYIYGSKIAWRVPSLDLNNKKLREQFVTTLMWQYKTMDRVLGLSYDEICSKIPKEFHCWNKRLSKNKVEKLKKYLLTNDELLSVVVKKHKEKRENAINYLKQIVQQAGDRKFAFVDIDGTRFSLNCMSSMVHDFYSEELMAFYLSSTPSPFEPIGIQYNHFHALRKSLVGHVMELLVRAPHGQTLGYQKNNEIWEPILENISLELFNKWGFSDYVQGLLDFTETINDYEMQHNTYNLKSQILMEDYIAFMTTKVDKETANLLGDITHCLYGDENTEFAPKISFIQALKYLFTGKIKTENILYSKLRSKNSSKRIIELREAISKSNKDLIKINRKKKEAYIKIFNIKISFRKLLWRR